jgi:hypothetical protein
MERRVHGYGLVLLLVIASSVLQLAASGSGVTRFLTVSLQAATLVAAVRTAGVRRRGVRLASLTATLAVAASVVLWLVRGDIPALPAAIVNGLLVGVAPAVLAAGLLAELRARQDVTVRTLSGVLAIYLLAGMFFSFLYGVIGAVDADALFAGRSQSTPADRLYFSFVTLTTVGYGDFAPAAGVPRAFAVVEMLIGQIYLVTVVSVIVAHLGAVRRAER